MYPSASKYRLVYLQRRATEKEQEKEADKERMEDVTRHELLETETDERLHEEAR